VSALDAVAGVLLWAGCAGLLLACVGMVLVRDVFDRLHYVTLAVTVAVPFMVVALALTASSVRDGLKLLLIGALLAGTGPATTAATARAEPSRRAGGVEGRGRWTR
jgi:monovalent cation/proton antiporter MnhG/PhaG subunit